MALNGRVRLVSIRRGMDIGSHPKFSWSQSRRSTFRECLRRYFYRYYASHRGWENDANPHTALTYRLKQITNLHLLVGSIVHELASEAILRARGGQEPIELDALISAGRGRLNRAWAESQDRASWERFPKRRIMLHEVYYGSGPSGPLIETIREKLTSSLEGLLRSVSYREAAEAPYIEVKEADRLDSFVLDGVTIYAQPDLLYRRGSGEVRIVDWKTGGERDGDVRQLRAYALYVRSRVDLESDSITGVLEYLGEGTRSEAPIPQSLSDEEANSIRDSISMMREYLFDPNLNVALPKDHFPLRTDLDACRFCEFYELDREEIEQRIPSGPF